MALKVHKDQHVRMMFWQRRPQQFAAELVFQQSSKAPCPMTVTKAGITMGEGPSRDSHPLKVALEMRVNGPQIEMFFNELQSWKDSCSDKINRGRNSDACQYRAIFESPG